MPSILLNPRAALPVTSTTALDLALPSVSAVPWSHSSRTLQSCSRIDTCPCSICHRRRPSLTDFRLRPQLQRRPDDHEPRSQGQGQIKSSFRGRQRGAGTTELRARLVPSGQGRDDLGPSAAVPQFMSRVREPGWQDAQQMSPLPSPLLLPTQTLPEGQHSSLQ